MNKFKIGDKVKVRDDLEVGRYYGELDFLSGMRNLEGKELTIDFISEKGNYGFEESSYVCSEEMLKKVFNDKDVDVEDVDDDDSVIDDNKLLKFALDKLNTTKEELEEEYKKSSTDKQILENIQKRCNDFESYCESNRFCDTCEVYAFKKRNNMKGLGTKNCMLVYEYLFDKK